MAQKNINNLLANLSDDFVVDILNLSEDEVLEEAICFHDDPQGKAEALRSDISKLIIDNRKLCRLIPAQKELARQEKYKSAVSIDFSAWSIEKLKSLLENTFSHDISAPKQVLLAFRNKENLSKDDLVHLIEELIDLGLIDDDK